MDDDDDDDASDLDEPLPAREHAANPASRGGATAASAVKLIETPSAPSRRERGSYMPTIRAGVRPNDFVAAVEALAGALHGAQDEKISRLQIERLAEVAPKDDKGCVMVDELLGGLVIIDKHLESRHSVA